jgi:uncharacterized protein YpmB
MQLSTTWIIVIVVVIFAVIVSNIMLLLQSNKPFVFPDSYEQPSQNTESEPASTTKTSDKGLPHDHSKSNQ